MTPTVSTRTAPPLPPPVSTPELVAGEPCEAVELPDDLPERGRIIELLVQTATERDAACVVRAIEQSYPKLAVQSPPPSSLPELRKWWEFIGSRAQRYEFGPDELVVLPELPKPLRDRRRVAFEPVLCGPVDPESCDTESRAFLAAAEQQLGALSELHRIERAQKDAASDEGEPTVEKCAEEARTDGGYGAWHACVRRLVPTRLVFPREAFRMPEQGVLRTHLDGDSCSEREAYSLKSGIVLTRIQCWPRASKEPLIRHRVERVDTKAVQRAALFIAISKELQKSPAYVRSFALPLGLEKAETYGTASSRSWRSHAIKLRYELHGVLAEVQSDWLYVHHESDTPRRFIVQLLLGLRNASSPSCATPGDKAELTELFGHLAQREEDPERTLASLACPP